jgi:hypothetical protein
MFLDLMEGDGEPPNLYESCGFLCYMNFTTK